MKTLLASKRFQFGFTLVELLIVVAIIAVLVSVGAVSYTTAQRNARDSQRKSDLKKIQLALEQFHADNGAYPDEQGEEYDLPNLPADTVDEMSCQTNGKNPWDPPHVPRIHVGDPFTCFGNTYLSNMPGDPLTGVAYLYEIHENMNYHPGLLPWCDNPQDTNYTSYLHGNCQKYTLWARLENLNDPEVVRSTNDQMCIDAKVVADYIEDDGFNVCVHQP